MKRSGVNGEDAPHAKRKKTQPGDLDMQSTQDFAQLQSTVTEEQESIIERPYSTQVGGRTRDRHSLAGELFLSVVYLFDRCHF